MSDRARVVKVGNYWDLTVDGVTVMEGESFTVTSRVADMVNTGRTDTSELGEVADNIIKARCKA